MSSGMSGLQISELTDVLARMWSTHGPDEVYSVVGDWDKSILEQFVMANLAQRAAELSRG